MVVGEEVEEAEEEVEITLAESDMDIRSQQPTPSHLFCLYNRVSLPC